jgi:predicted CopG family antitoxin
MDSKLSYIKTRNSLKRQEKLHVIKNAIVNKIQRDIDISKLRENNIINNELILFCSNCVEELVKKKYSINKKEFVIDILRTIFGSLNDSEVNQIKQHIEFVFENQLIKKVELNYKARVVVWNWIQRKFL